MIASDQGPHFTASIVQKIANTLNIKWDLHSSWHPQSAERVERMNASIKLQLTKLCTEVSLKWVDVLPIVFFNIRTMPSGKLKLSLYELLCGKPPLLVPKAKLVLLRTAV